MPDEPPAPGVEPSRPEGDPAPSGRNLPLAIATGLLLAGVLFGTLFASRVAFLVLVAAILSLAQYELYEVLRKRGLQPATLLGIAAGLVLLIGAHASGPQALSFVLTISVVASFLWYLADPKRSDVAANVGATMLGIVYVPFMGAHVIMIRAFPDGIALVIATIGAVAFYDIGAYAAGSLFGRHRIAPQVSPSKTWEGAAGATLVVVALGVLVGRHLGPLDTGSALALAAIAAVAAPLGDLAESLIKRDLRVKDMGGILPGHGGALDRVDAMLLAVPAAYWLIRTVVF